MKENYAHRHGGGGGGGARERDHFTDSRRNAKINYKYGVFFVTVNILNNRSICGTISEGMLDLNDLGREVEKGWIWLQENWTRGFSFEEFVVMPNHFHGVVEVRLPGGIPKREPGVPLRPAGGGAEVQKGLPSAMREFKRRTTEAYQDLVAKGRFPNYGNILWGSRYHDRALFETSPGYEGRRAAVKRYIERNPRNWERDRFGAVTKFQTGNAALLGCPLVAYVASQELTPGCGGPLFQRAYSRETRRWSRFPAQGLIDTRKWPVISTFMSPQEKAVLRMCLAQGRRFVWVSIKGLPAPGADGLADAAMAAAAAGKGLILSPFEPGTFGNKPRANWCNTYVLKHAAEIRTGYIRPCGSLESLLRMHCR